jgi:hypothetical protein
MSRMIISQMYPIYMRADGVTVTSLSASLCHMRWATTERVYLIVLNQKLSHLFYSKL